MTTRTETPPQAVDGRSPLWRAHNAFRIIAFSYACVWVFAQWDEYAHRALAAVVLTIMAAWTVFTVWRFRHTPNPSSSLVLADQALVTILLLSSEYILTEQQMISGAPTVVTVWHASMVTAAGMRWGMLGGGISGTVAAGCDFLVRAYVDTAMWMDLLLLTGTGLLVGLASDTARASTERLRRALLAEAATAERERLARSIHDSVLQVLARVHRRGDELGGEAAELAKLAGEQECALRALVATTPPETTEHDKTDLTSRLQSLGNARVQVSVPPNSVLLPTPLAMDLVSIVREALENFEHHAGSGAQAWVLLEDLPGEVVISIRDDGAGIPEGRLAQAESEGRLGVAQSMRGRVASLGGTISLDTEPGEGTEWEIRIPHSGGSDRTR